MKTDVNGNGLTFEEWLGAANYGSTYQAPFIGGQWHKETAWTDTPLTRRAWRADECPTDYAAAGPARAEEKWNRARRRYERDVLAKDAVWRLVGPVAQADA